MPTGYTYSIYDDISFENFVLSCARNFGALIHMRDESNEAHATLRELSNYYTESLKSAEVKLQYFKNLSKEQIEHECYKANDEMLKEYNEQESKRQKQLSQLLVMKNKVIAWKPPTEEHNKLKEFMLNQINETINFDCSPPKTFEASKPSQWIKNHIESCEWNIEYYTKKVVENSNRTNGTNQWIIDLYKSLGVGDKIKKLKTSRV